MSATYMCAAERADFDTADYAVLLDISVRIAAELGSDDFRVLAEGFHRGASDNQRIAALLLLAGPLTDVIEPADEEVLLRAFLPRLSMAARARVLAEVRDDLTQAQRFADCYDRGDVVELVGGTVRDWVAVAEERAARWRDTARWTATQGVQL